MTLLRQADFCDRNNFADFLNRRGLTGEAAEVGVHRADFSNLFLDNWHGKKLYLVDPYTVPAGYESQAALLSGNGDRGEDQRHAHDLLARYGSRAEFLHMTSIDAKLRLMKRCLDTTTSEEFLDFVYIDGDHRKEKVEQDLFHWWHLLKPGGILAGHDILSSEPYNAYEEVQPAVLDFARGLGLDVYFVVEIQFQPWSFYIEKPL